MCRCLKNKQSIAFLQLLLVTWDVLKLMFEFMLHSGSSASDERSPNLACQLLSYKREDLGGVRFLLGSHSGGKNGRGGIIEPQQIKLGRASTCF